MESVIKELEESAESAKAVLVELQETSNEAQANLDKVKKTNSKASKAYDRVIKEIAALNDSIEKLASERLTIYKRSKLEEIDLPLKKGSLDSVPLDEVGLSVSNVKLEQALDADFLPCRICVKLSQWTSMAKVKILKMHDK